MSFKLSYTADPTYEEVIADLTALWTGERDFLAQLPVVGRPTRDTVIQARNPLTAPLGPKQSTNKNGGPAPTPTLPVPHPGTSLPVPLPSGSLLPGRRSKSPAPGRSAGRSSCSVVDVVLGGC